MRWSGALNPAPVLGDGDYPTPTQYAASFPGDNDGVVLAATAGAVNVKLGPQERESVGQTPEPMHLRAVVGLVWRTVVMWMVFLALLSLARLLG